MSSACRALLTLIGLAGLAIVPVMGQDAADTQTPDAPAAGTVKPNNVATAPESASATKSIPNPLEDARDRIYYPDDTERMIPLLTKLGGNVLLDQKEIWLSPFHMHKKDAKWWIGFGAVTAALIATDHQSSHVFTPGQVTWAGRVSNVGAEYTLVPIVAGFYAYGVFKHNAQAREVGVLGTESLVDALITVTVLKTIAGRNRPDNANATERGDFFDGGTSFPSGHAIESWALASLIAHEYKKYGGKFVPYLAYALATGVSVSRYVADRHYASDIVAGGAMGWFLGRYVYQTHETHASHHHAWLQPQIGPSVDPITRTYALSLQFATTGP